MVERRRIIPEIHITSRKETHPDFDYGIHTREVQQQLRTIGIGPTVDMLTPEGLHRPTYLSWARGKLLGEEFSQGLDGKELPMKIGEVDLPENLRTRAKGIAAQLISMNVGYGHLRPALALQNVVELLGGEATSIFLGGDKDYFRPLTIPTIGKDESLDRLIRTTTGSYRRKMLEKAYEQGLIHEKPEEIVEDPAYVSRVERLIGLLTNPIMYIKDPEQILTSVFALTQDRTDRQKRLSAVALRLMVSKSFARLIEDNKSTTAGKKDHLVISTHGVISQAIGSIPAREKERLGYEDANFQPDVAMLYDTHTHRPITYTEKSETAEKWAYKQGKKEGHASNTVVIDGYVTPLSIFEREGLSLKRREALLHGEPLTVIATASGIAPAQVGAFKEFIFSQRDTIQRREINLIVECGAQEGGGLAVMHDLQKFLQDNNVNTEGIVLHTSATPEASLQFFEALTWSEKPLAMLVKGSEMTRIAQALNIPLISVGALGDHEWWNIAATMLDNAQGIMFAQKTAENAHREISRIFPNDPLTRNHPERQYASRLLTVLSERSTSNPSQLIDFAKSYIASGTMSSSRPDAMFQILEDMLLRKDVTGVERTRRKK